MSPNKARPLQTLPVFLKLTSCILSTSQHESNSRDVVLGANCAQSSTDSHHQSHQATSHNSTACSILDTRLIRMILIPPVILPGTRHHITRTRRRRHGTRMIHDLHRTIIVPTTHAHAHAHSTHPISTTIPTTIPTIHRSWTSRPGMAIHGIKSIDQSIAISLLFHPRTVSSVTSVIPSFIDIDEGALIGASITARGTTHHAASGTDACLHDVGDGEGGCVLGFCAGAELEWWFFFFEMDSFFGFAFYFLWIR